MYLVDQVTGQRIGNSVTITANLTHLGVSCQYTIQWNYPILTLTQTFGGTDTLVGSLMCTGMTGLQMMVPFFANESDTDIVTDYAIGTIQLWQLEAVPLCYDSGVITNPGTNPQLVANIDGRETVEIACSGNDAGTLVYVEVSQDATLWFDAPLNGINGSPLALALTSPSGKVEAHGGYLNAYRYCRVTINEKANGTYRIQINASKR